jgi:hypothetical protein
MQDIKSEEDEEICVKVNLYLGDVDEARKAAGFGNAQSEGNEQGGGVDDDQLLRIMQGALGGSEQGRAVTGEYIGFFANQCHIIEFYLMVKLYVFSLTTINTINPQQFPAKEASQPLHPVKSMLWVTFWKISAYLNPAAQSPPANTPPHPEA